MNIIELARKGAAPAQIPMKTYGYIRVSTEEQATSGLSLADQRARLEAWAMAFNGAPLDDILIDPGMSGKTLDRPQMQTLLSEIRAGRVAKVVVAKLDRLTRNVRDLGELVDILTEHHVQLISLGENVDTNSAMGRMILNMMGTIAQWERETIVERTKTALDFRRKTGRVFGRTPYGWRAVDGRLVPDLHQQAVLSQLHELRLEGVTYEDLAAGLNAAGEPTPRGGKRWDKKSVYCVLRSAKKMEAAA